MDKKMWYKYLQWSISHKKKKNETLPFAITWMDLEGIKLNKSEIDKYYMILLLRGIWKNKTNVTKQKQS